MKGQGNIIVAVLFFSILILSIIPLTLYMYNTPINRTTVYEDPLYTFFHLPMKTISGDIVAFFDTSDLVLQIANRGGTNIEIERIILNVACNDKNHYITSRLDTIIQSGQTARLHMNIDQNMCINPKPSALHIITKEGAIINSIVITPEDIQETPNPITNITMPRAITSAITAIPIKISKEEYVTDITLLTQKGFEICTLDNMINPTRIITYENPAQSGMRGGTTTTYIWTLVDSQNNINIEILEQIIRNLWIGYDPRNISKYNIMITADSISISKPSYSTTLPVRIKIYGFRPSTTQGILQLMSSWITEPSQDVASYTFLTTSSVTTRLTLRGFADRIEIYVRSSTTGDYESGYNPYILFMSTVRNQGFAGILFTTIDRIWGNMNSRNDYIDSLVDYSIKPLVLVYRNLRVSNVDHSAVIITINYRFHDNEGSDAEGTSVDRPIMFVGLVDDKGNIYSYRSYTFRELTRYEDTYPTTAQAQSSIVFIPLPPRDAGEKIFYVFIAIQDPYHYNGNLDDLDFTLYIESLAIIPIK